MGRSLSLSLFNMEKGGGGRREGWEGGLSFRGLGARAAQKNISALPGSLRQRSVFSWRKKGDQEGLGPPDAERRSYVQMIIAIKIRNALTLAVTEPIQMEEGMLSLPLLPLS